MRWLLALGLVLVAPMSAEYVAGYDDTTGQPLALAVGLLIFAPLYGAPALLIREVARRFGVRWPGILALAAAAGLLQAGVIDQSMFSLNYRDIWYWDAMVQPTLIEPLGLSMSMALAFVVGHTVWSFGIPIALVESLRPDLSGRPWLGWPGLGTATVLYVAAATVVWQYHMHTESDHASVGQIVATVAVAALLAVFAFTAGRRAPDTRDGAVPAPILVAVSGVVAGGAFGFDTTWVGVAIDLALLTAVATGVAVLARSSRWDARHVVALATGVLVAQALAAFITPPLGGVEPVAKYGHNLFFLAGSLALGAWAYRRARAAKAVTVREHSAHR